MDGLLLVLCVVSYPSACFVQSVFVFDAHNFVSNFDVRIWFGGLPRALCVLANAMQRHLYPAAL